MLAYSGISLTFDIKQCGIIYLFLVAVISLLVFMCELPNLYTVAKQTPDQLLRTNAHK